MAKSSGAVSQPSTTDARSRKCFTWSFRSNFFLFFLDLTLFRSQASRKQILTFVNKIDYAIYYCFIMCKYSSSRRYFGVYSVETIIYLCHVTYGGRYQLHLDQPFPPTSLNRGLGEAQCFVEYFGLYTPPIS